jgi:DNA repair exonuclease SbcCD ATPase subunit
MPNRQLTADELRLANVLLGEVRQRLLELSGGDPELLFAYRRKVSKELTYDERSKPAERRKLKELKRREQNGLCPLCSKPLPPSYCVPDRFSASAGYTRENTRLICQSCDATTQAARRYA